MPSLRRGEILLVRVARPRPGEKTRAMPPRDLRGAVRAAGVDDNDLISDVSKRSERPLEIVLFIQGYETSGNTVHGGAGWRLRRQYLTNEKRVLWRRDMGRARLTPVYGAP